MNESVCKTLLTLKPGISVSAIYSVPPNAVAITSTSFLFITTETSPAGSCTTPNHLFIIFNFPLIFPININHIIFKTKGQPNIV